MAQQEAEQQLRDTLLLFQQHVQQTLDPTHSPHLSASQRNHIRHVAQHVFHHLAGPVRKKWLHALDTHSASLSTTSTTLDTSTSPTIPPVLLTDLSTAQSQLSHQHDQLQTTLQQALNTLRSSNLHLVSEGSHTDTPSKRRKTGQPQLQPAVVLEEEEASRVVVARAEVDNVLDEVNELLKKERLELGELHTFLVSHPSQHDSDSGAAELAAGGEVAGGVGGVVEAGRAGGGGVAGGTASGGNSASSSQLSSPSSGHSKQVAAGLAKRLNRSAAM